MIAGCFGRVLGLISVPAAVVLALGLLLIRRRDADRQIALEKEELESAQRRQKRGVSIGDRG